MTNFQNLTLEQQSYIYGIFLTDGSISKIKNKEDSYNTSLELNIKDADIINKIQQLLPEVSITTRTRNTNFKDNYESIILRYYSNDFPKQLFEMGFPKSDKTENAIPPNNKYDERAFWRGVIDGDGSLGIRKISNNRGLEPFVSLTTKSEKLKESYCTFLYKITGKKYNPKPNKRDNIYNILISKSSAKKVLDYIYQNASIYLERKYNKYIEINDFIKQTNMPIIKNYILKQIDKNTNELIAIYNTCAEAEKETGFSHIADASNKNSKYKTYKGYIWQRIYEGDEEYDIKLVGYRR